ncbi:hypothetical protein LEP1GSC185_0096 [Leptospira licerasiae serovar Varillal str. VAR 010]|nr:hypothetical protein LEP1GSC185_0096 [Leptospira licerasiae serovar Varillal str. VAR 010]
MSLIAACRKNSKFPNFFATWVLDSALIIKTKTGKPTWNKRKRNTH